MGYLPHHAWGYLYRPLLVRPAESLNALHFNKPHYNYCVIVIIVTTIIIIELN
jgi:hypothetical protein